MILTWRHVAIGVILIVKKLWFAQNCQANIDEFARHFALIILYSTVLYYSILYSTVLYYTLLYCTRQEVEAARGQVAAAAQAQQEEPGHLEFKI